MYVSSGSPAVCTARLMLHTLYQADQGTLRFQRLIHKHQRWKPLPKLKLPFSENLSMSGSYQMLQVLLLLLLSSWRNKLLAEGAAPYPAEPSIRTEPRSGSAPSSALSGPSVFPQ